MFSDAQIKFSLTFAASSEARRNRPTQSFINSKQADGRAMRLFTPPVECLHRPADIALRFPAHDILALIVEFFTPA